MIFKIGHGLLWLSGAGAEDIKNSKPPSSSPATSQYPFIYQGSYPVPSPRAHSTRFVLEAPYAQVSSDSRFYCLFKKGLKIHSCCAPLPLLQLLPVFVWIPNPQNHAVEMDNTVCKPLGNCHDADSRLFCIKCKTNVFIDKKFSRIRTEAENG